MAAITLLGARGGPPALSFVRVEVRQARDAKRADDGERAPAVLAFADLPGASGLDQTVRRASYVAVAGPGNRAAIMRAFSPTVEPLPHRATRIAPAANPDELLVTDGRRIHVMNATGETIRSAPAADRDVAGELDGLGFFSWRGVWNNNGGQVMIGDRIRPLATIGRVLLAAEPHRGMCLVDPASGLRRSLDLPTTTGRRWTHECTSSADGMAAAFWLDRTLAVVDASGLVGHRVVPDGGTPPVWLGNDALLVPVTDRSRGATALVLNRHLDVTGLVDLPPLFRPHLDVTGLIDVDEIVQLHRNAERPPLRPYDSAASISARSHQRRVATACALPESIAATTRPSLRLEGSTTTASPPDQRRPISAQIGGRPQLPSNVEWPHAGREPMAFLAQFDLATLHAANVPTPLPTTGSLFVFGHLDPGGHEPGDSERATLIVTRTQDAPSAPWPTRLDDQHRFDPVAISCSGFESVQEQYQHLPDLSDIGLDALDQYLRFLDEVHPPRPDHRCFGFHRALQRDDIPHPSSPHQELLLQLDTDARLGAFWGPGGMVYVYVDPDELATLATDAGAPAVAYGTLYLDD